MSVFFYGCVTLDGYLADKRHGLDWLHQCGTVEGTGFDAFYRRMDATVMGRRTFREIERLEHPEEVYPSTRNYVFTHEERPPEKGFHFVRGDVAGFVKELGGGQNVWIVGGGAILAPLLEEDLVDTMIVQIAPVLLGDGVPLFQIGETLKRFRLDGVRRWGQFAELEYGRS